MGQHSKLCTVRMISGPDRRLEGGRVGAETRSVSAVPKLAGVESDRTCVLKVGGGVVS